jgi:hypothetical protein
LGVFPGTVLRREVGDGKIIGARGGEAMVKWGRETSNAQRRTPNVERRTSKGAKRSNNHHPNSKNEGKNNVRGMIGRGMEAEAI